MKANISIFSVIRNTGLLFLGMVLALGIAEYQKELLWNLNSGDTVLNSMKLFSADVFFDTPLNKETGTSLNIYAIAFLHDYGPGYIRNLGINNMANGMDSKI